MSCSRSCSLVLATLAFNLLPDPYIIQTSALFDTTRKTRRHETRNTKHEIVLWFDTEYRTQNSTSNQNPTSFYISTEFSVSVSISISISSSISSSISIFLFYSHPFELRFAITLSLHLPHLVHHHPPLPCLTWLPYLTLLTTATLHHNKKETESKTKTKTKTNSKSQARSATS